MASGDHHDLASRHHGQDPKKEPGLWASRPKVARILSLLLFRVSLSVQWASLWPTFECGDGKADGKPAPELWPLELTDPISNAARSQTYYSPADHIQRQQTIGKAFKCWKKGCGHSIQLPLPSMGNHLGNHRGSHLTPGSIVNKPAGLASPASASLPNWEGLRCVGISTKSSAHHFAMSLISVSMSDRC